MSGRPLLQTLAAKIDALGDDDMSGEDVVFARIADGEPVGAVAKSFGVSRQYMYVWRDVAGHKERRRALWEAALKASADAKAEEGESILDTLAERVLLVTPADVALARARADYKLRLASVRDRERYGEKAQAVSVNVTVQSLHLDALRLAGTPRRFEPEVQDAELLIAPESPVFNETQAWEG